MFESHFGFSATPFQLSPDPGFYFDSAGHRQALSYLKYGVYQGEGFVVFTGDVGSGKTMVVRKLLESLKASEIVAAHVVNTQLDSIELLRSICDAFHLEAAGSSKAQLLTTLEVFFTAVAAGGRRVLLVIDEAQNLGLKEVEELRMLSNYQVGNRALIQSFLVGQPELRLMLASGTMEQLRQRVIASCHLGPLSVAETRGYVEHRLRRVGWYGFPAISDRAYVKVHALTDGIPRRVNQLFTRVLLASWLTSKDTIASEDVANAATALAAEFERVGVAAIDAPKVG